MRSRWSATVAVAVVLAAGCGGGSDSTGSADDDGVATTSTTEAQRPPFEVATHTERLVDPSRPTPENTAGVPASEERVLETIFTYPDAPGPHPLIAFAHGLAGHPRKFSRLFDVWASEGYVVAAPAFPLSNDEVPGTPDFGDLPSQPGDLSFVIDEALRLNDEDGSALAGRVDPERVGVAGLSLGGATAYGVTFNDCCLDDRVDAAIVMDGARLAVGGEFDLSTGVPLLIFHADEDPQLPYQDAVDAFAEAVAPKYLVTIHERVHAEPFEDAPDPADPMVEDTTVAFWRTHLDDGADDVVEEATVDGLTTVESET